MDLTREEEAILNGEEGEGKQKAMELVTALGKIYGADDLIDITSAHLSGASYIFPVRRTRPSETGV